MNNLEEPNIVFVVLHYNNLKETKKCITSLKKYLSNINVHIVIVDNGSPVNRLDKLKSQNQNPQIHYIISQENLGFARGNNLGFKYAKEKLKANIIILTNNDTWFEQKDFITLLKKYYENGFDVAGPKILTNNGKENQNPITTTYTTPKEVDKVIFKFKFLNLLWLFNLDNMFMKKIVPVFKRKKANKNENRITDFKLHGACLIFSSSYIDKFNGLSPQTFMYGEEDFLKYIVDSNDMKFQYFNDLEVFHKGNASTDEKYGLGRKKRKFYYYWNLDSFTKLKNLMMKNKK